MKQKINEWVLKIKNAKPVVMALESRPVQWILESKKTSAKIFMILSGLLLLLTFVLPLWKITLEAPQYPTPLGMYIYINRIGDAEPHDVKNINLLNHYVGMKEIPEHMKEFEIFPPVIITMAVLAIILGFLGKHQLSLIWLILMALLGIAGLYDFYIWEYDYGHNLDPKAILKFTDADGNPMGFQPPLFGTKHILNFVAHSYPASGAIIIFISMLFSFISIKFGRASTE